MRRSTPCDGLGENPETVKRLLHTDAEALAAFEAAIVGKLHVHKRDSDIVTITPARGNAKAYTSAGRATDRSADAGEGAHGVGSERGDGSDADHDDEGEHHRVLDRGRAIFAPQEIDNGVVQFREHG